MQSLNKEFFSEFYDTKVLSLYAGPLGKTDLQYLYDKCKQNKKYNNNLSFQPDEEAKESKKFSIYEQKGGQGHDAGYDAYMTGLVFASLSKFIEIGNIINKNPEPQEVMNPEKPGSSEKTS